MISLYDDEVASKLESDLELRVYTSRLLGRDSSLVLHGGGNTSVKCRVDTPKERDANVLYVKGSGWDLATIESKGFAPVYMKRLLELAKLDRLSDEDMVKFQREAMLDSSAPNPSVEAILHAIIPFKFVDHTHADAVVSITNSKDGVKKIEEIYGDEVLIVPYIMPGFDLAKLVYKMTDGIDWSALKGIVLLNHGLFTFDDSAKISYENTIELVDRATKYIDKHISTIEYEELKPKVDLLELAKIRYEISKAKKSSTIQIFNQSPMALKFSQECDMSVVAPLTPDHSIRTKRVPLLIDGEIKKSLQKYIREYEEYFKRYSKEESMLNSAPNYAILKDRGALAFGKNPKDAKIVEDISNHTFEAIIKAQRLGGYVGLEEEQIFGVEYWSLEQAKLKKSKTNPPLEGKIAFILNAQSNITKSIIDSLREKGATIVLSSNKENRDSTICECVEILSKDGNFDEALESAIKSFGGVDIVVDLESENNFFESFEKLYPFLCYSLEPQYIVDKEIVDIERLESIDREKIVKIFIKEDIAKIL